MEFPGIPLIILAGSIAVQNLLAAMRIAAIPARIVQTRVPSQKHSPPISIQTLSPVHGAEAFPVVRDVTIRANNRLGVFGVTGRSGAVVWNRVAIGHHHVLEMGWREVASYTMVIHESKCPPAIPLFPASYGSIFPPELPFVSFAPRCPRSNSVLHSIGQQETGAGISHAA